MNKRLLRMFSVLLVLGLCISSIYIPIKASWKATLNKTKASLEVGQSIKLSLSGSSGTVTWKSEDSDIAKVSSKGVVTAKDSGYATITATDKGTGSEYTCDITVYEKTLTIEYGSSYKIKSKKGIKSNDYEVNDEFDYCSFSVDLGSTTTIKPTKKPKYKMSQAEIWIDYSNNTSCLYNIIVLDSESTVEDTTTPAPTQKPVATPTPRPTATPTPTPAPVVELDISDFTKTDYFLFTVKTTSGSSHLSKVIFTDASFSDTTYSNSSYYSFKIDYSAYSDNLIESGGTLVSSLTYRFNYKIKDSEGAIVKSGSFWLPEMYIGNKVKGDFEISIDKKYGNKFILDISSDTAY